MRLNRGYRASRCAPVQDRVRRRRLVVCAALLIATTGSIAQALTVGPCRFDRQTLAFAGTANEQPHCLLKMKDRDTILPVGILFLFDRLLPAYQI
jgi:hypothetical protein